MPSHKTAKHITQRWEYKASAANHLKKIIRFKNYLLAIAPGKKSQIWSSIDIDLSM